MRETGPWCASDLTRPRFEIIRSRCVRFRAARLRDSIGERRSLCTYALRRFPDFARYRWWNEHVKEQSVLSCFPPSSPGSCLAHKESSKSPFLPIFLPPSFSCSGCRSLNLSSVLPSFRVPPSLPPPPALIPFASQLLSRAPLSRCPPRMLMYARSATVLAGPPVLTSPACFQIPFFIPRPSLSRLSSPSLFVYLAKFDSPTRSDLTFRSLLVPCLSSLPRLSSYRRDSLRAGIFLLVPLLA